MRRERTSQNHGSQADLARRARISARKVSDVERGIRAGTKTYDALEPVLGFPPGSIEHYLRRGGPLPKAEERAGTPPDSQDDERYEWSAESRRRLVAMSMEEVLQLVEHTRLVRGDAEAERVLRAVMRLRDDAANTRARSQHLK